MGFADLIICKRLLAQGGRDRSGEREGVCVTALCLIERQSRRCGVSSVANRVPDDGGRNVRDHIFNRMIAVSAGGVAVQRGGLQFLRASLLPRRPVWRAISVAIRPYGLACWFLS